LSRDPTERPTATELLNSEFLKNLNEEKNNQAVKLTKKNKHLKHQTFTPIEEQAIPEEEELGEEEGLSMKAQKSEVLVNNEPHKSADLVEILKEPPIAAK
jgi:hypothetical protein